MKRWTKKIDLFEQKYILIPINAFRHWWAIIIYNLKGLVDPDAGKSYIVYCDSMFEKRPIIIEAIRKYIELEIKDKK